MQDMNPAFKKYHCIIWWLWQDIITFLLIILQDLLTNRKHCIKKESEFSDSFLFYSITLTLITPSIASILGIISAGIFTLISTMV